MAVRSGTKSINSLAFGFKAFLCMVRRSARSGASGRRSAAQTHTRGKSRRAATQAKARAHTAEQAATARILGLPVAKPVARPARPVAKPVVKPVVKPVAPPALLVARPFARFLSVAGPVSAVTVSPARPVSPDPKLAPVTPTKATTPTSPNLWKKLTDLWDHERKHALTRPTRHPECLSDTVGCGHVFCDHCYPPGPGPGS